MLLTLGACNTQNNEILLKVSVKEIVLVVGETFEIKVESHSLEKVVFTSENSQIATVNSNGLVTAIGEGETQILVTVAS